jgi:hypothetical protein
VTIAAPTMALAVAACGPSAGTHLDCAEGAEQCICFSNNTCNAGLNCVGGVCVSPNSGSNSTNATGSNSGSTSSHGSNGTTGGTTTATTATTIVNTSTVVFTSHSTSTTVIVSSSTTTNTVCNDTPVSGALYAPADYQSALGGGVVYSYQDNNGSTACIDSNYLCGAGTTGVADSLGMVWGAGIGLDLNSTSAANATAQPYPVSAASSGIYYTVSTIPTQGLRIVTDDAGVDYCATISSLGGVIYWTSFNTQCWDPLNGSYLSGPPSSSHHINFQVPAVAVSYPFNFCVGEVLYE